MMLKIVVVCALMACFALIAGSIIDWLSRDDTPEIYQWNRPEVLPPVGCPLVLQIDGRTIRGERVNHLSSRAGAMDYLLSDGSVITGRFAWSYP